MGSDKVYQLFQLILSTTFINKSLLLKPNVLLILVDDLRPELGVYGSRNAYTPNIDALAETSFVFTNTFAQQSLCAPSRNSLLTSRRPDSLHLYDFNSYWRDTVGNFTTLPQHFRNHGYITHSVGKVFHPGASSNFTDDAPYSWSGQPFHPSSQRYKDAKVCSDGRGGSARNLICPVIVEEQPGGTLPDFESLDEAMRFVDSFSDGSRESYFLAVGFQKPHIPFKYPLNYLDYHPIDQIKLPKFRNRPPLLPSVAWNPWIDVRKRDDVASLNISFPFGPIPDDMTRMIIQSYNAAVTYVDDLIGQLLTHVNVSNTVIVLTSDHGWSLGEHGEFAKYSNFEVATRVPLIIKVPNLTNSQVAIKGLSELVDLFPTLVDLTSISPALPTCSKKNTILCTEGSSLVPIMLSKGRKSDKNAAFSQYPRPSVFPTLHPNSDEPKLYEITIMGYSVRTPQYRYTAWIEFDHKKFRGNWTGEAIAVELYDHYIDPEENLNLATRSEMADIMKGLRKKLLQQFDQ